MVQLTQSRNKQKSMVLQLGRYPEKMGSLVQAFGGPALRPQSHAYGQGNRSKLPASACPKLDTHYLLLCPREESYVPVGDLPKKSGL